jgi:ribosomal protein S12 methylthiotransferase
MNEKTFYLISLGCAKNTVDSSSMATLLIQKGYRQVSKSANAKLLIVNTCGFIQAARDEAIQTLSELAGMKKPGQMLVAAGCLTERYNQVMLEKVPKIDGILGTRGWMNIIEVAEKLRSRTTSLPPYHIPSPPTIGQDEKGIARIAIQGGSAYLKIADGCHRPCAFCTIPLIKGTTVSRPQNAILEEARLLRDQGISEINLIAQDTTSYGYDLGLKDGLSDLLLKIIKTIPDIPWIRILYAYPGYITDRLIEVMAENHQILPYLDMPLQHADRSILQKMHRPANTDWVYQTLEKMRQKVNNLTLRTTFIVGYPGETEERFQTLLDFVSEIQFDHIGVFSFSFEVGTASEILGDPIPNEVKQERIERLMLLQQDISLKKNQAQINKVLPVLIEGFDDNLSIGRSYRDAPEIDGLVFVEGEAPVGKIINVKITGALPHDLIGHIFTKP